jgi:hypothetical protein
LLPRDASRLGAILHGRGLGDLLPSAMRRIEPQDHNTDIF